VGERKRRRPLATSIAGGIRPSEPGRYRTRPGFQRDANPPPPPGAPGPGPPPPRPHSHSTNRRPCTRCLHPSLAPLTPLLPPFPSFTKLTKRPAYSLNSPALCLFVLFFFYTLRNGVFFVCCEESRRRRGCGCRHHEHERHGGRARSGARSKRCIVGWSVHCGASSCFFGRVRGCKDDVRWR
jgi:hypothetical protein